ncbi:MAG: hypothetical protein QNJ30_19135 [Kiloniellales bacterium]|nr:hypothetical protein [Kiloniellales bacterium]
MKLAIAALLLLVLAACQAFTGKFPQRYRADEASYAVTGASEILVVYIGAANCPPCYTYKARDYPVWARSQEYAHVRYRELRFPLFQRTDEDRYWPEDLRWVRDAAYARQGAPRWILAVDGRVVANELDWRRRAFPLIRRLVARKRAG